MQETEQQKKPAGTGPLAIGLFWGVIGGVSILASNILSEMGASLWWFVAGTVVWVAWACVAVWVEKPGLRSRKIAERQEAPKRYSDRIERLLTSLERAILPRTVANDPKPKGIIAGFFWAHGLQARDNDDLKRLARNPLSWPVHDLALRIAIAYPIFFVLGQFVATDSTVRFADYVLVPSGTPYWWAAATLGAIATAIFFLILAPATSKRVFEKLSTWLFLSVFAVATYSD